MFSYKQFTVNNENIGLATFGEDGHSYFQQVSKQTIYLSVIIVISLRFTTLLNPLDPIEISENPSEILGKSPF